MPDINEEMRLTADFAISTAKERYGLVLDYSEESLSMLDDILEKIYWGFSSHSRDEGEGGLIYNTAIIWGSYLGEYMRLKWGGTWLLNGTERRVSITSIELSPITFVFQRITDHPEYRVKNYVLETKNLIYTSVIHPKKTQFVAESAGQPATPVPAKPVTPTPVVAKPPRKPINIDRRTVYIAGGVLGLLFVLTICIVGYTLVSSGGLPAFGLFAAATRTSTITASPTVMNSPTISFTDTPIPTATELPTYTPRPTQTTRPSSTPLPTDTPIPTWTPTETPVPTDTYAPPPTRAPTDTTAPTQVPPTKPPATATNTPRPPTPTTPPPSPEIVSCGVNPSSVPSGSLTSLTFSVQFNVTGLGMNVSGFNPSWPGQAGCSADAGGSTGVSCGGNSGALPPGTSVTVTIQTPIGSCQVGYSTP